MFLRNSFRYRFVRFWGLWGEQRKFKLLKVVAQNTEWPKVQVPKWFCKKVSTNAFLVIFSAFIVFEK